PTAVVIAGDQSFAEPPLLSCRLPDAGQLADEILVLLHDLVEDGRNFCRQPIAHRGQAAAEITVPDLAHRTKQPFQERLRTWCLSRLCGADQGLRRARVRVHAGLPWFVTRCTKPATRFLMADAAHLVGPS